MKRIITLGTVLMLLPAVVAIVSTEDVYNFGDVVELEIDNCQGIALVEVTNSDEDVVFLDQGQGEWQSRYHTGTSNSLGLYTATSRCFLPDEQNIPRFESESFTTFTVEFPLLVETNKNTYDWGDRLAVLTAGCKGVSRMELINQNNEMIFLDQGKDIWGAVYDTRSSVGEGLHQAKVQCGTEEKIKLFEVKFPLDVHTDKYRYHKGSKVLASVKGCNGVSTLEITADPALPGQPRTPPLFVDQGLDIWGATYDVRSDVFGGVYTVEAVCGNYKAEKEICIGSEGLCGQPEEEPEEIRISYVPMHCGDSCDYFETVLTCPEVCSCPVGNCYTPDADEDGLSDEYELHLQQLWLENGHENDGFSLNVPDSDGDGIPDGGDYCPGTFTNNGFFTFDNHYINSIGCYIGDVAHKTESFEWGPSGCLDTTDYAGLAFPYKFWEGLGTDEQGNPLFPVCPSSLR